MNLALLSSYLNRQAGWSLREHEGDQRGAQGTGTPGPPSRSRRGYHTYPAQARHGQGDTRLEVIRVLLAETSDEADSGCDHALRGQERGRSGPSGDWGIGGGDRGPSLYAGWAGAGTWGKLWVSETAAGFFSEGWGE